jgi:osmotically-inducible protein OsmY
MVASVVCENVVNRDHLSSIETIPTTEENRGIIMKRKSIGTLVFAAAVAMLMNGSPARASSSDDSIESSFMKTYVYRTYLKDDAIQINAENGIVTLTGRVSGEAVGALAQATAASLPGVTGVNNQLKTDDQAAKSRDAWIGGKVKVTLLFHRNVNGTETVVEVRNGIVTLKGEAADLAQKELTAEYAADIEGVTTVKNEMTVAARYQSDVRTSGVMMDDASISGQVKTALLNHRSTSAVRTGVETRKGEVTLTGIAKNSAEKSLVSKLVSDIRGVTGVKNQMTVSRNETK